MITTLTGENDVMRQQALAEVVQKFVAEYGDMALERIDGEEVSFDQILGSVQSLPFLVPKKLIVLRSPGTNKEFTEKFDQLLESIPETNEVIILEPKLDKRTAYYKQLKRDTHFREFTVLEANALIRHLSDYAKGKGGSLSMPDTRLLIDRVGPNQLILQHEIDKLLAYAPAITHESIELLTERTPQSSIFELLDTAFAGNAKRAMELYDEQRALRVEPQQIIAMIIWQLHVLAIVKAAGTRSTDEVAKQSKISPFTVRKTQGLARHMSLQQLKELVTGLREFDIRLKSEGLDADEVTRFYLLQLTRK